jgi:hypothetical protein
MKRMLSLQILLGVVLVHAALAIEAPTGLVSRTGDRSIVLHWDRNTEANLSGYRVYRALNSGGPFVALSPSVVTSPGFCDLSINVVNGQTNFYRVTALTTTAQESVPSITIAARPQVFASDDEFLEYLQQTSFDYFWYLANPNNGLIPDRSTPTSPCSIAAVGFGLSAIGIGIDHGWISRPQGVARVLTTLNTFLNGPQGNGISGTIGYKGWFYHFIEMNTAVRSPNSELSSIDTALLLAGMLNAKQFFNATNADETAIRTKVDAIFNRVDWNWMAQGTDAVSMGWFPNSGFIPIDWIGYNEGMILYCLGLGAPTNPLPASSWNRWTNGYIWATNYGLSYVQFPPLFGHEYSHCWIDFRHIADPYMNNRSTTYHVNSRRATLANRAYCIANPAQHLGYSSNVWGLTACDGPTGYAARGAPPALNDDGTIAPTAAGGAMAFTPEYSLPTMRYFYSRYRPNIWTAYGFRDAFNLGAQWWGPDELGIDQGPIVIMIENYRTQRVWQLFMQDEVVQRGLQRAGFVALPFVPVTAQALPDLNTINLTWAATAGRTYQVEYSTDLSAWFSSPTGEVIAFGPTASWTDSGPPATTDQPFTVPKKFYRVFQFGAP